MKQLTLGLDEIEVKLDLQLKTRGIDIPTKDRYREAMSDGAQFPPLKVFYDGEKYWLADGFHRWSAYEDLKVKTISVEVEEGGRYEAKLASCIANALHGKTMSSNQRYESGRWLIENTLWDDLKIAQGLGVSQSTVAKWRKLAPIQTKLEQDGVDPDESRQLASKELKAEETARKEWEQTVQPDNMFGGDSPGRSRAERGESNDSPAQWKYQALARFKQLLRPLDDDSADTITDWLDDLHESLKG